MGVAGSISPPGGAPKPDPARVAAIRYTIVDEPETCAAFGEAARATLASLSDRAPGVTRAGDLGECGLLLDHIRDRVAGLDPTRLTPRGGLAGLFDSRTRRLKAFRAGYAAAAAAVSQSAGDVGDRAAVLARKESALESLWSETRDAIAELDAHIAAARGWLANEAPAPVAEAGAPVGEVVAPAPVEAAHEAIEAQADAEALHAVEENSAGDPLDTAPLSDDQPEAETVLPATVLSEAIESSGAAVLREASEPDEVVAIATEAAAGPEREIAPPPEAELQSEPEPVLSLAPVTSLPHPLETRLAALEALRATAIGRLPLLRAAQNADCRTPAALKEVCDGVEAWRADWRDALGLSGKKPKKLRPDRVRLSNASSALADRVEVAAREVSAALSRRAELDARSTPASAIPAVAA